MKKYFIIALVIAVIIVACWAGSYVFALGMILLKFVFGLVAVVIFTIGILIGRFFPYKKKEKQILKG